MCEYDILDGVISLIWRSNMARVLIPIEVNVELIHLYIELHRGIAAHVMNSQNSRVL